MTLGHVDRARALAKEASTLAERAVDEVARVKAALRMAETAFADENLTAAAHEFTLAATLAHAHEETIAEALATVGLGRVLLRRKLYAEATGTLQNALAHLRGADDPHAQALATLAMGQARRALGDDDAARSALARAGQLATHADDALLTAEVAREEARSLLDRSELATANRYFEQAISTVERVAGTVPSEEARIGFCGTWSELYAEAIFASASDLHAERALTLATDFAAGADRQARARAAQHLREFEQALPTRGAGLSKDDIERNKAIAKVLSQARQALRAK